jgi:hypothetical protein
LALLFLPGRFALAEEVSCSTDEKFKDGSSRSVELKLKLDHDRPTQITFEDVFASGEEGGAYFCNFAANAADHKSVWAEEMGKVTVRIPKGNDLGQDPGKESNLEISRTTDGFLVRFVDISRVYCGFGAEFPQSVRLVKGRKKCVVVFPTFG